VNARPTIVICLALALAVGAAFSPVAGNGFVDFDDPVYITANPNVAGGITARGLAWAFTSHRYAYNWHPLTWISHMADVSLFGLDPRGHHLAGLVLHGANAVLLFLVWRGMTGSILASACVAALFAIHPLRVESVAWASERKDLLCVTFSLLTVWAYLGHLRRRSIRGSLLVVTLFAAALMSKPMAVTLPLVLLLLDVWPLGRWGGASGGEGPGGGGSRRGAAGPALVAEKLPLLTLSAASGAVTLISQGSGGVVGTLQEYSLATRIHNALASCLAYLGQAAWPAGLAVFYPHRLPAVPSWETLAMVAVPVAATAFAFLLRRRAPYLLVGWLWYLVTLLPVIGLVQVGMQARADRYTLFPLIGISLIPAWGMPPLLGAGRWRRALLPAALITLALFGTMTLRQAGVWQDSPTLYRHAIRVVPGNWWADFQYGWILFNQGRAGDALPHLRRAADLNPDFLKAHYLAGLILASREEYVQAIGHYREVLRLDPSDNGTRNNLGVALTAVGDYPSALAAYAEVIRRDPDDAGAHFNRGMVLEYLGDLAGTREHFRHAVRIDPGHAPAADALARQGALPGSASPADP
jgi:tetratricopeptide (TPR) repeat protein